MSALVDAGGGLLALALVAAFVGVVAWRFPIGGR